MRRRQGEPLAGWIRRNLTPDGDCLVWTRAVDGCGYGQLGNGRGGLTKPHRVICEDAHGPAPAGKPCALHTCDNPPCCNPEHLYWGNQADNGRDKRERKRARTGDHRGERHGRAKLTELRVRLARRLVERGAPIARLARWYGVSAPALNKAVNRRTWRHVA